MTKDEIKSRKRLDFVRRVYFESFPVEERRPWDSLESLAKEGTRKFTVYVLLDDGLPVAFMTVWSLGWEEATPITYIEHFAVDSAKRGMGYGTNALNMLAEELGGDMPVVVEVEPSGTTAEADRRIAFYGSLGFVVLDHDYIQPSYGAGLPDVPLTLMVKNGEKAPSGAKIEALLHKNVYKR